MKTTMKRLLSMVIAFVMVLSLMPAITLPANAAAISGLTDSQIGLSGTANLWTVGPSSLSCTVQGEFVNLYLTSYYKAVTETLTITNNKGSNAVLSFDFKLSGNFSAGSITIGGTKYTSAVSTLTHFETELEAGASVKIVLSASLNSSKNNLTAEVSNISLVKVDSGNVATTLEAPAYGSYTVSYDSESTTIAAGSPSVTLEKPTSTAFTFTATPGTGYKVFGWYNVTTGQYLSTGATYTGYFDTPSTVKAIVVPTTTAVFNVGGAYINGLQEALSYAASGGHTLITLASSGTVPAGNYTIPAGTTLLIPSDNKNTPVGDSPDVTTDVVAPTAYLTLTLADGAVINVNGNLECEAVLTTMQGGSSKRPYGGRVAGTYGAVYMNPNSQIIMNNGSNLYVWGYIYGDGEVLANAGSNVYESMQVCDFPGGTNLSVFVDTKQNTDADGDGNPANDYVKNFFFSQYYIQNIEVALTIYTGAREYAFASMTVSSENVVAPPVEFIGPNGMFIPSNGYVVKDYDPSTDRLMVTTYGDASIRSINISMKGTEYEALLKWIVGSAEFNSADYILNLNSNMTIHAKSGTLVLEQDIALQPGVEIYVDQGATLKIAHMPLADDELNNLTIYGSGGYNVYLYDLENWGKYVFSSTKLVAASYSPTTGRVKRTASALKDVVLDVNGTIICDGYLYTTVTVDENFLPISGGAAITSSQKTGKIIMNNGAGIEEMAFRLDGTSSVDDYMDIASAWLKNGDGTYLETAGAEPGAEFNYCPSCDSWFEGSAIVVDPTCSNGGYSALVCSNCGHEFTANETESRGHSYNAVVTAPTCTTVGYTTYTCSVCGDNYVADEVVASGHSYNAVVTAPTCTTAGYTTYTCSACGDSYVADEVAVLGHSFSDATCTNAPVCSICGATEGEAIGHSYNAVVTAPDCVNGGYTTYTCSVCCDSYVGDEVAALGHSYNAAVTAPDCVNGGYTTYTCDGCGDSYVADRVSSLGHSFSDATCTDTPVCVICGATEGEALGHSYNAVVTAPTCGAAGYTTYTCSVCGDSYVGDEVAATGAHNYTYSFANNKHTLTCSGCNDVISVAGTNELKFRNATLSLASDISVIFKLDIDDVFEVGYMVFEVNGEETYVYDYTIDESNGRKVFAYQGINPQMMGDSINCTIHAYLNGTEVTVSYNGYSVVKYCNSQFGKTDATVKQVCANLLEYGAAVQLKKGYKTDALVNANLPVDPETFPGVDAITNQQAMSGTANNVSDIKSVALQLSSKVEIKVGMVLDNPADYVIKATIKGNDFTYGESDLEFDEASGRYYLYFSNLNARDFDETITFVILKDGVEVSRTLTYSVNSYIAKNGGADTADGNTLRALYCYGKSTESL